MKFKNCLKNFSLNKFELHIFFLILVFFLFKCMFVLFVNFKLLNLHMKSFIFEHKIVKVATLHRNYNFFFLIEYAGGGRKFELKTVH